MMMMKHWVLALMVAQFSLATLAAPRADNSAGKRLHDAHCTGCHDSGIYIRKDRKMRSLGALKQQLGKCSHMAKQDFSSEETSNILKYLNDSFYHFQ